MEGFRTRPMAVVVCAMILGLCAVSWGRILYVDDDAVGAGNGASWNDAFVDLQDALTRVQRGDEIRVAQGVYSPDRGAGFVPGDWEAMFVLVDGVTLAGGYAGVTAVDSDARDIERYETVLSADLYGDDGPNYANSGENALVIVSSVDNDSTTILQGFTITGIHANGGHGIQCLNSDLVIDRCTITGNKSMWEDGQGAGVFNIDGSPTLRNCVLQNNWALHSGAGFYSKGGTPLIVDCVFEDNVSEGSGGGLYLSDGALTLERCTFHGNQGDLGAGMYVRCDEGSVCVDCRFMDNVARSFGGGVDVYDGIITFSQCSFEGNSADYGGGLYVSNQGPVTLVDCTFRGNTAEREGGGMSIRDNVVQREGDGISNNQSPTSLTRCVFRENVSRQGGAFNSHTGAPALTDCLFQNNVVQGTQSSGIGGGAVYVWDGQITGHGSQLISPTEPGPAFLRCRFVGNLADGHPGGGLYNANANTTLTNCLFVGNIASQGGALYSQWIGPVMTHCTIAQNRADKVTAIADGPDGKDSGLTHISDLVAATVLDHCIVWDHDGVALSDSVSAVFSDIDGGWPGQGNIDVDPLFARPGYWGRGSGARLLPKYEKWVHGDYHLMSQAGRWDSEAETWVQDEVTSPCIDAGDPKGPIGDEPFPNGGIANLGAYGGSAEANKSYFGDPLCDKHLAGDINGDCKVGLADLLIVILQWTEDESPTGQ